MDVEVVVIGGQEFTPYDIMQMTPAQFAEFVEMEEAECACVLPSQHCRHCEAAARELYPDIPY